MTTYLGSRPDAGGAGQAEARRVPRLAGRARAPGHGPHLDGARLLLGALLLPLPRQARPRPQRQHRRHPDAQAAALACPRRSANATWSELLDTPAEQEREAWIDLRDTAVLLLLYGAGLRIGEALGLTKATVEGLLTRRPATRSPSPARATRPAWCRCCPQALDAHRRLSRRLPVAEGGRPRRRLLHRRARRRARSRHRAEAGARHPPPPRPAPTA